MRHAPHKVLAATVLLAALPLIGGCGIRTTTVPVDAGPAPSRVSCAVPRDGKAPETDTAVRQVYLVCSMQTTPVKRSVTLRPGRIDRLTQVRELVAQLQRSPLSAEAQAGFSTEVPGSLEILGPFKGDPENALRLNQAVDELPSFALAQIVCTLADDPSVTGDGGVVLGGDDPDSKLRRYTCTPDLRTRPDAADSAGTAVG
ncbi:hypothetical protein [Streptomyces sp. CBMA29]|uniref:hypothetical protein n=1 Tax=Streptomyces sp. CBMA29 TaxID=1896314 RepID=UPI001661F3CC|nr:hypothetical protein [Streptomyces sp. CBMA29]